MSPPICFSKSVDLNQTLQNGSPLLPDGTSFSRVLYMIGTLPDVRKVVSAAPPSSAPLEALALGLHHSLRAKLPHPRRRAATNCLPSAAATLCCTSALLHLPPAPPPLSFPFPLLTLPAPQLCASPRPDLLLLGPNASAARLSACGAPRFLAVPPAAADATAWLARAEYALFLRQGATARMRPQCELVGCRPEAAFRRDRPSGPKGGWAIFRRVDAAPQERFTSRHFRQLHQRYLLRFEREGAPKAEGKAAKGSGKGGKGRRHRRGNGVPSISVLLAWAFAVVFCAACAVATLSFVVNVDDFCIDTEVDHTQRQSRGMVFFPTRATV
ncbi:hypothetical protein AB1Y20_016267 [Prymnesium parvum]|uniref:Uncharacterized protein n=1 Tax=Prymnesium parvum TaxID=97485 RepID=A0AB34IDN7_PRYPA